MNAVATGRRTANGPMLSELGLTFDDVVLLWNRCAKLDEIEEDVLMTRSRDFGLTRPLAELSGFDNPYPAEAMTVQATAHLWERSRDKE